MYIPRAIEETVRSVSKTFPVLLLTGPRQVGKTTLLQKMAGDDREYVTLDDPDARYLAKKDPALFLQRYVPPVTIDEIQYAPELLPYIKIIVDKSRKKGDFWLTGSQLFHVMKGVTESLAGRVGIIDLLALSNSEIHRTKSEAFITDTEYLLERVKAAPRMDLQAIYRRIFIGGMPALYAKDAPDRNRFFASYVQSYLERDIRDLAQVADEMAFYNFLTVVAARTARPVIYEEIAREVGISAPTVKQWLSILLSSRIIALVQPYHNNVLKRTVKMPLLHFLDTGLAAYLLKWNSPETLEAGAMSGQFFESWVFSELYKSYINAGLQPPIYYYRDKDKREIDMLLLRDGVLCPIEIKKAASVGTEAIKHFGVLQPVTDPEKFGELEQHRITIGQGAVICAANDLLPLDRKNWLVPAWVI
ncbi:MAG: hypothetical protein BWY11_02295 [Firmicutes bacterium ADurb.Bin182]|nr:MAG: hypothetical protein BWY11_02295 [Firmicutes bacterium ADurb.Bin182]